MRLLELVRHPVRVVTGAGHSPLSRPNYRRELVAAGFLPIAVSCVDMGVTGVVAKKVFGAGNLVVALLEAAPHAAALSSILWTGVMHGRDRVRFVGWMQIGLIACVAAAAIAPVGPLGVTMLVASVVLARCFFVGMLTGRTELWRANYGREARARATGVFTLVTTLVIVATTLGLGLTLDAAEREGREETMYRVFYFAAAAAGVIGVLSYRRVRWRGRGAALREERQTGFRRPGLASMWAVWRDDRNYRRYMNAQMVMGSANLAAQAPVVLAVTDRFDLPYTTALAITAVVPKAMMVVAIPLWSRMLARLHIVDFRAIHAWSFVIGNALVGVGVLTQNVPLLLAARGVVGAGLGGGSLAWNLGHHDFAPRAKANSYMGLHVVLTGVRGAIAPLLGAGLYSVGLGGWTFILCAVVGAWGAIMFVMMRKHIHRRAADG